MEDLCKPCNIKYDFIGKMETFTRDSQYILSTVFKSNISLPAFGVRTGTQAYLTKQLFADLPPKLRKKVIHYFSRDARLFGYDIKPYI